MAAQQILLPVSIDERHTQRAAEVIASLPGDPADLEVIALNVFREFEVTDEGGTVRSEDFYDEDAFPETAADVLDALADDGVTVTMRREHGDPAATILSVADELDVDFIVMSGRERSPTGKAIFGSVTQSVLLSASCPVITAID